MELPTAPEKPSKFSQLNSLDAQAVDGTALVFGPTWGSFASTQVGLTERV
jgi:hypothetical protein